MNIVISYDSSGANAPAGFKTAVQAAVNYFDKLITTPITVNITFSYGEILGQTLGSNALGESSGNGYFLSYNQVVAGLAKSATSAADIQSLLAMPATDPTHGGAFWVTDAQAKAFGITGNPNFTDQVDGYVGLTNGQPLNFSPDNTSVSGQYSAVGVIEHEISEILGRTSGLGSWSNGAQSVYTPLDLFRYSAPGVRSLNQSAAYFSVDGSVLLNKDNGGDSGADLGDWGPSVYGDSFGYGMAGQAGVVTSVDQLEMDVLGYTLSTTTTSATNPAAVTISYSQFKADTAALAALTNTPFNLTVTGVSITDRITVENAAHVAKVGVSGSASDIAFALDQLNSDSKISTIVVSDNRPVVVSAAQATADAHAISELINADGTAAVVQQTSTPGPVASVYTSTAAQISSMLSTLNANTALTSVVIQDNAPLVMSLDQWSSCGHLLSELSNKNGTPYALILSDTAANIAARFDTLNGAAHVKSIQISDNSTLVLTANQAVHDSTALAVVRNSAGQTAKISVTDTAANILANLAGLNAATAVTSVVVSDNAPFTLSAAQYVTGSRLVGEVSNQNGTPWTVIVSDTAAQIVAHLDAFNGASHLKAVVVSDNAGLQVTASQAVHDSAALALIKNANGQAVKISVVDTSANIAANLSGLISNTAVGSVVISDNAPLVMSIAQIAGASHLMAELSNQNGSPYTVSVRDTAAQIGAHFDSLNGVAHVASVVVADNAPPVLTVTQALHDTAALGLLKFANGQTATFAVSDTAAHLAANLDALKGVAHLGPVTASDGGALNLTWSQYQQDGAVLAKLQGAHSLVVTGAPGPGYTTDTLVYGASGALLTDTHSGGDTTSVTVYAAGQTLTSLTGAEAITAMSGGETFVINNATARMTITGFNLASDVLSFSHGIFANSAALAAAVASDGHGGVIIHTSATGYVDLVGVTLAQLQQHASDIHLFY